MEQSDPKQNRKPLLITWVAFLKVTALRIGLPLAIVYCSHTIQKRNRAEVRQYTPTVPDNGKVQGQPALQSEFKASLSKLVRPCLKFERLKEGLGNSSLVEPLSSMHNALDSVLSRKRMRGGERRRKERRRIEGGREGGREGEREGGGLSFKCSKTALKVITKPLHYRWDRVIHCLPPKAQHRASLQCLL